MLTTHGSVAKLCAGYGLAFGIGVLLTGWISAYFNPALALTAWINGNGITSASEYFAISFSTICGVRCGAKPVACDGFAEFEPPFMTGALDMAAVRRSMLTWSTVRLHVSADSHGATRRRVSRWPDGIPAVLAAFSNHPKAAGGV